MDTALQYHDLVAQYPTYMSKEQMCRVCHISKETCLFLLKSELVPCLDSGKKTRRYKIQTTDMIKYLEDREIHPERYKPPEGFYKSPHTATPKTISEQELLVMRQFYEIELERYPDVLRVSHVLKFTGYCRNTVNKWCQKGKLKHFNIKQENYIPKPYLIDFLVSWDYIGIAVKSKTHKRRNDRLWHALRSQT